MPSDQTISAQNSKAAVRVALMVDMHTLNENTAYLLRLFIGLTTKTCFSAVICPNSADGDLTSCLSAEFIQYPILKLPFFWRQNRGYVLEKLRKFKPTVLHCLCPSRIDLAKYLSRELDIPFVMTFGDRAGGFLLRHRISTDRCGALVTSSKATADRLENYYKRFAGRIDLINTGAFVEDTCACFANHRQATSMVVAKRLENPIEFEPLLSAARHLAIDGYEFILAIIGKGPAEKAIYRRIKSLGLSENVTLSGRIYALRPVFADADIYIQTGQGDKLNSPLLEAMSVGMAVASSKGRIEDVLAEDNVAVFFDGTDELSIYSCLKKLIGKREFARKIAASGQSYIRKYHTVSNMIDSIVQTYRNAQQWYKRSESKRNQESEFSSQMY